MIYTIEQAKAYVAEHIEGITKAYMTSPDVPAWARPSLPMLEAWKAGCWLNAMLKEMGADEDEAYRIGFVHGQRSFGGDPWVWGVAYANEYALRHSVKDQPGPKLADEINREVFGKRL